LLLLLLLLQGSALKELETRNTDLCQQVEQLQAQLTNSSTGAGEEAEGELGDAQTAGPSSDAGGAAGGNNASSSTGAKRAGRSRAGRQRQPLGSGLEREAAGAGGGGSNLMRHALVWSGGAAGAVVAAAVVAVAHGRSRS
jgi:hypothetical protein